MSITKFSLVGGDGGNLEADKRDYTDLYLVVTDNVFDGITAIRTHPNCPIIYLTRHRDDSAALCASISPTRRAGTKFAWDVSVRYSTEIPEQENPLARGASIIWTSNEYTRPYLLDSNGKAVLNRAQDWLKSEIEDVRWVLSVEKNLPDVPTYLLGYANVINDGDIDVDGITFPRHTLRTKGLKFSDVKTENDVRFRTINFELHHKEDTWKKKQLNVGYQERFSVTVSGVTTWGKRRILVRGEPPADEQFLDDEGKWLGEDFDPADIVVIESDAFAEKPFSLLPLR